LIGGAKKKYGLETYCLFVPRFSARPDEIPQARYAVLEPVEQNEDAPAGTGWVPVRSLLREKVLAPPEDFGLRNCFEELERHIAQPSQSPFAKPGWIRELSKWTQSQIEPLDLQLTGKFTQLNAGPSFSLIRMETTGPAVWFKATGGRNFNEFPIICTLARLIPSYLAELIGVRPHWNGWLSRECDGETLDALSDVAAWVRTADTLARLEIASIGKSRELLDCGCRDRTVKALAPCIDDFLARIQKRMRLQLSNPPAILANPELAFLADELKHACSSLDQLGLPDVLGHLDFNPGNIVVSSEKCAFLDWSEGSVVEPFVTFCYLREHAVRTLGGAAETQARIVRAYLEPWQSLLSPRQTSRAMALSSIVAVFAYALAVDEQTSPGATESPASAGFLRSLARRMHREATEIHQKSEQCRR